MMMMMMMMVFESSRKKNSFIASCAGKFQTIVFFPVCPRSRSHCLSLPLCLQWYIGGDNSMDAFMRDQPNATV